MASEPESTYTREVRFISVKNSYVYRAGTRLLKYIEKRCKELGLNYDEEFFQESKPKRSKLDIEENSDDIEENGASSSENDEREEKR